MAWLQKNKNTSSKPAGKNEYNSQVEQDFVTKINQSQSDAESGARSDILKKWADEYRIYIGGQWETSFANRTAEGRKRNFNSQDNFIFSTIQNMYSSMTTSTPEGLFEGREAGDDVSAKKINDLVPYIFYINKFSAQWKKIVMQYLIYGPAIAAIEWDQHWTGGSGPNRWVGEISTKYLKKEEFYPDPAILDLEERLQDCSFINIVQRKKLDYFKETWSERGRFVLEDNIINTDTKLKRTEEGPHPLQANLVKHWHRGVPEFVSPEWKQTFEDAAVAQETDGYPFKAQELRDMAAGKLKGVHVAYSAGTVLLDYIPYMYDDGLYPFIYKTMYIDEEQPWGMGEVRNLLIPQVCHNKADEIELEAMTREGLGGHFFNRGAITPDQRDNIINNNAKASVLLEVEDIRQMIAREGVRVPQSIQLYKEQKQKVIDTVSQNTAIQQGMMPGTDTPGVVIQQLGARADVRSRGKIEVLEDFCTEILQRILSRIGQFYTQERTYRILGGNRNAVEAEAYRVLQKIASMPPGTPPEAMLAPLVELLQFVKSDMVQQAQRTGTFSRNDLVKEWVREETVDENGQMMQLKEQYVPEFDTKVKVVDERPIDRNYYTNIAMQLLGKAMGIQAFWKTIDEGKFPPIPEILAELEQNAQQQMQMQQQQMQAQGQQAQQSQQTQQQSRVEQMREQSKQKVGQTILSDVLNRRNAVLQPIPGGKK